MRVAKLSTQHLTAEFIGTAALLLVVVGSGIMGENLASGNAAIALLANALATGAGLYVLISVLGPISGAHFNPVVTLCDAIQHQKGSAWSVAIIVFQTLGAVCGVLLAHAIFDLPILQVSSKARDGWSQGLSEVIATLGLLITIAGFSKFKPQQTAAGVGLYVLSAYWFTSSTSFANPAVTLARSLTNTFAGIAPQSVGLFLLAQFVGLVVFFGISRLLFTSHETGGSGSHETNAKS